jgi:phosphocarrier protein HPr
MKKRNAAEGNFTISNLRGMHARSAGMIATTAQKYQNTEISLIKNGCKVNAKSIFELMTLAAAQGSIVRVITKGKEAQKALEEIGKIINGKFGEEE